MLRFGIDFGSIFDDFWIILASFFITFSASILVSIFALILNRFWLQNGSQNRPLGGHFRQKSRPQNMTLSRAERLGADLAPHDPTTSYKICFFSFLDGFWTILGGFWLILDPFCMDFGGSSHFFERLLVQPIGKTTTPRHNERRNEGIIKKTKRPTWSQHNDPYRKTFHDNTTIDGTTKRKTTEAQYEKTTT